MHRDQLLDFVSYLVADLIDDAISKSSIERRSAFIMTLQDQKMKFPPVDKSGTKHLTKIKKPAQQETVMKENLDEVIEEVYTGQC